MSVIGLLNGDNNINSDAPAGWLAGWLAAARPAIKIQFVAINLFQLSFDSMRAADEINTGFPHPPLSIKIWAAKRNGKLSLSKSPSPEWRDQTTDTTHYYLVGRRVVFILLQAPVIATVNWRLFFIRWLHPPTRSPHAPSHNLQMATRHNVETLLRRRGRLLLQVYPQWMSVQQRDDEWGVLFNINVFNMLLWFMINIFEMIKQFPGRVLLFTVISRCTISIFYDLICTLFSLSFKISID